MKLNAGIITEKLAESKDFYTQVLQFGVTFENDFYLLLHTPNQEAEISFLLPNHPSQQPLFQKPFTQQGVPIAIALREEPWGDRHFAIIDPNGIGIDIVTYSAPE